MTDLKPPSAFSFGTVTIAAASLYNPLVLWARNVWDLGFPLKLVVIALALFIVAFVPYWVLTRAGLRPLPVSLGLASILLLLMNWHKGFLLHPLWWLALICGVVAVTHVLVSDGPLRALALVAIAVLGIAPALDVVLSHLRSQTPYPIVDLAPRQAAEPTGLVEDVLIVIVDSYPSLAIAEGWFQHDTSRVRGELEGLGYQVADVAWSQHTFSALAVPSILELQPVAEPGPTGQFGNRLSVYRIMRGESLVAESLRSAGFEYTHVESGWIGSSCGDVDRCLRSAWIDGTVWELFRPSFLGGWMVSRLGSADAHTTLRAADHLAGLSSLFGDGHHDYVFAHLLLPHAPMVVDSECEVRVFDQEAVLGFDPEDPGPDRRSPYSQQFSCVDTIIIDTARLADSRTAVMFTGDHGPGSGGQVGTPPHTWTDPDIAERFGVFLAYRLPEGCRSPVMNNHIEVMRAIMECAVVMDSPENHGNFLIGAIDPVWVEPERMEAIQSAVENRSLAPREP